MARMWARLGVLSGLMLVVGCYTTERVRIKPPKHEEVYALPPVADTRFDEPLKYPKGLLNQDYPKMAKDSSQGGAPGAGGAPAARPMAGPRMGGAGGGGGY